MRLAAPVVFTLYTLEAPALPVRKLRIVRGTHVAPVEAEVHPVVPDEVLLFLLVRGTHFASLSCGAGAMPGGGTGVRGGAAVVARVAEGGGGAGGGAVVLGEAGARGGAAALGEAGAAVVGRGVGARAALAAAVGAGAGAGWAGAVGGVGTAGQVGAVIDAGRVFGAVGARVAGRGVEDGVDGHAAALGVGRVGVAWFRVLGPVAPVRGEGHGGYGHSGGFGVLGAFENWKRSEVARSAVVSPAMV